MLKCRSLLHLLHTRQRYAFAGVITPLMLIQPQISEVPLSPAPVNMTCAVCMDRKIDAVYLDCGHSSTCLPCAQQMLGSGNQDCPICRKPCRIVRRIFIAAAES